MTATAPLGLFGFDFGFDFGGFGGFGGGMFPGEGSIFNDPDPWTYSAGKR
jgi:hypothetical protein